MLAYGRVLLKDNRHQEGGAVLGKVINQYETTRDLYGFRLGDLARLKLGEVLLKEGNNQTPKPLQSLVQDLLTDRWTITQGAEGAIVNDGALPLSG